MKAEDAPIASNSKLWPVNQLQEWIHRSDSKFLNITSTELCVLLAILKFADNQTWSCSPSIKVISNLCLKDKKHVQDIIKKLINKNILFSKKRMSNTGCLTSNEYIFSVDNLWKTGAYSAVGRGKYTPRVGVNIPLRGGKYTPLTIYITNNITKKKILETRQTVDKSIATPMKVTDFLSSAIKTVEIKSADHEKQALEKMKHKLINEGKISPRSENVR